MIHSARPRAITVQSSKWWTAVGIFLFVLGMYVLSSPGRIDLVDGQVRFDVAYNWLTKGRPVIGDPWIAPFTGVPGRDRQLYSFYGAPASVFSMPLVWLGGIQDVRKLETSRFLFSMTSPIFGALIALVLFLFYLELEVPIKQALAWTMVSAFATLVWPSSNSTFDNAQHAFFALAAMYFGFLSAKAGSKRLAALGGLLAGVLILYQPYFLVLLSALALSTLNWKPIVEDPPKEPPSSLLRIASSCSNMMRGPFALLRSAFGSAGEARESYLRFACFLLATSVGLFLHLAYNQLRFGSYLDDGKLRMQAHSTVSLFANPLSGLLTLLVSPGKSIFLYSPPIILGFLGMRYLWRRKPELALGICLGSVILVLFFSCISFAGGDWCWGPRYLVVVLPLWALGFPFLMEGNIRRGLLHAIVTLGLIVQVLALSVENQRFFREQGFQDYFWAYDRWVYFKHSALFSRVGEVISLVDGPPPSARNFNAIPVPDWYTYTTLGPVPEWNGKLAKVWMRYFRVFWVPRPWPLWMLWIKPGMRPVNLQLWLGGLLVMITTGSAVIYRGVRTNFSPCISEGRISDRELIQE
jgi:hypothetical protein